MVRCPRCDIWNPTVKVIKEKVFTIKGEGEPRTLGSKQDVEVACLSCRSHFVLQYEVVPAGIVIDLS